MTDIPVEIIKSFREQAGEPGTEQFGVAAFAAALAMTISTGQISQELAGSIGGLAGQIGREMAALDAQPEPVEDTIH